MKIHHDQRMMIRPREPHGAHIVRDGIGSEATNGKLSWGAALDDMTSAATNTIGERRFNYDSPVISRKWQEMHTAGRHNFSAFLAVD